LTNPSPWENEFPKPSLPSSSDSQEELPGSTQGLGGEPSEAQSSFAEEAPPAEQGPELSGALPAYGRALDEAQRRIHDGSVEPELLDALEMTPEAFKAFVEKYEEHFGRAKALSDQTQRPTQTEENAFELGGEQELRPGDRNQIRMDATRGAEAVGPETLQGLDRSTIHQVAPEYRDAVEGYFRTVGQASAATQPEEK
jgi:hypothetical protein